MSDTSNSAIIEKIRKMLALAERGGTEAEASTAAEMAAAMALRYGIDLKAVQGSSAVKRGFVEVVVFTSPSYEQWAVNVLVSVAELNAGTSFFYRRVSRVDYVVVVRAELVEVVRMTFDYLSAAILRFNRAAVSGRKLDKAGRASFRTTFRLVCSQRLRARLMERLQALKTRDDVATQATGANALVVASHFDTEMNELGDWMTAQGFAFKKRKKASSMKFDPAGFAAGVVAGNSIGLDAQVGGPARATAVLRG